MLAGKTVTLQVSAQAQAAELAAAIKAEEAELQLLQAQVCLFTWAPASIAVQATMSTLHDEMQDLKLQSPGRTLQCVAARSMMPMQALDWRLRCISSKFGLSVQLDEAEASTKTVQQAEEVVQASRYGATVSWCQDVQGVLAALSGVTVLRFEEDCIAVRLRTSFHTSWEPTGVCSTLAQPACCDLPQPASQSLITSTMHLLCVHHQCALSWIQESARTA